MKKSQEKVSRTMSYALRHKPEALELSLSSDGWVSVQILATQLSEHLKDVITVEDVEAIVEADSKQRYTLHAGSIRANQGHSTKIDLGLAAVVPPRFLYHGTVGAVVPLIKAGGLISGKRQHVHLSTNLETAREVGERHGSAILLRISAEQAHFSGIKFFVSENKVWLAEAVPSKFIEVLPY